MTLAWVLWDLLHLSGLLGVLFYVAWLEGDWLAFLGLRAPSIGRELLWAVGLFLAMNACFIVSALFTHAIGYRADPPISFDFDTGAARLFEPLTLLLGASLEEAFYRAWLWTRLTQLTARPYLSITIASLLFSASHFYAMPNSMAIVLEGWVLGWAFYRRRSLYALILAHWGYNLAISYAS